VFDVEIDAPDIELMVSTIAALEPTFGGINLEDIKAPECFEVEEQLKQRMRIPVFHDDQHGTAIIVAAAIVNGLELAGKKIEDVKIVTSGAGAAALACLNLLVSLGARVENIWVTDRFGVAWRGRVEEMDRWKDTYVKDTPHRTLADVLPGADVFLGLSAAGVLKPDCCTDGAHPDPGAGHRTPRSSEVARAGTARRHDLLGARTIPTIQQRHLFPTSFAARRLRASAITRR